MLRGLKPFPMKMQTVDSKGNVTEGIAQAGIVPPHPDACQVCGTRPAHLPTEPHNALSLYYQYTFYGEHGRWPTWKDAVAHCDPNTQATWEAELRSRGVWTEPNPEPAPFANAPSAPSEAKFKAGDVVTFRKRKGLAHFPPEAVVAAVVPVGVSADHILADLLNEQRPSMVRRPEKTTSYICVRENDPKPYLARERDVIATGKPPIEIGSVTRGPTNG